MLSWKEKVNQTDKKNVQSLFDIFDKFISQNHKTDFSHDQRIRRQWQAFKKVIQADPADVQSQNQYVNIMKSNVAEKDNDFNKVTNRIMLRLENITPILLQINRNKLQQVARKTSKLIQKDNKNLTR